MSELQAHSIATAHVMRLVCQGVPQLLGYEFLSGLLHDVGAAAGILVLAGPATRKMPSLQEVETVKAAVLEVHESCGEMLARAWHLPPQLWPALTLHHSLLQDGEVNVLAAAVCVAEALATELGYCFGQPPPTDVPRARKALGLTTSDYGRLLGASATVLSRLSED